MNNNTALARTDSMEEWQIMRQQAEMLVKTKFLPSAIQTPEQAIAIIMTGRELGIGMMQALNNISVIQGKPTVSPQLMLALINRSGQVEDINIQTGADGAKCTLKRKGRTPYTAHFGPKEAQAMGLSGKDNYKKQPATMYKWRAVADACRVVFPDIILGVYLPEEMGAQVEADSGEVVEATPEPPRTSVIEDCELREEVVEVIQDALTVAAVRNVKLEGAQPKAEPSKAVGPKTREILAWMDAMGWDSNDLANYIYQNFDKLAVDDTDAVKAINALDDRQKKQLHQMIEAEFKGRQKAAGK